MQNEVAQFIAECVECNKASIPFRHFSSGPASLTVIDLLGSLPEADGSRYILVIDPFSHLLTLDVIESATSVFSTRSSSASYCKAR